MAKKEEVKDLTKPVEVRAQTEDEVRRRLKSQGKLAATPKKDDDGVHEQTEEEAMVRIEDRKERENQEDGEGDPNVRQLTKKDVALHLAADKKRAEGKKDGDDGEKISRVQTDQDIKDRTDPDPDEEEEKGTETPAPAPAAPPDADKAEPVEIYAKDVVTFKDDDGKEVTGKVKRVTSKGEAILDVKEGDDEFEYTVPCDILTKVEKEEK